ncbi:MAG: DUF177 domain-containing protein [Oscillospiraceae bacterium]|nr:DUF177 domain-containing protein [Oscillospiraceae bacterium]
MVIDVRRLFENPGEKLDIDGEISRGRLEEISGYEFLPPVEVKGTAESRAGIVTMRYTVNARLNAECGRCLGRFIKDFSFEFEHIIVRELYGEDTGDYVVAVGDKVDLDELGISDLLPEMPSKLLCKEDCKGLCPKCGADLNESDCGCERLDS